MPTTTTTKRSQDERAALITRANRLWSKYSELSAKDRRAVVERFGLTFAAVGAVAAPVVVQLAAARTEWDLALANWLDKAFQVVAQGTDESVLHVANELDRLSEAVTEQARKVRDAIHAETVWWLGAAAVGVYLWTRARSSK